MSGIIDRRFPAGSAVISPRVRVVLKSDRIQSHQTEIQRTGERQYWVGASIHDRDASFVVYRTTSPCGSPSTASSFLGRRPPRLGAFFVRQMAITSCRARELGSASGTVRFGCSARLFPLMSEEVAESGKPASIAAVLPALRLRLLGRTAGR